MKTKLAVAVLAVATLTACSKEAPPPAPAPPPPVAAPAPPPPPEPAPVPPAHPAEPVKAAPVPPQAPTAKGATASPKPAPAAGETLPALVAKHGKVGDAKCRMCHKLQHDSWSASPHAAKGLDCEGCHGGGADFVKVMRDRTAALAAGLMLPKPEFCKRCHKSDWQDAMFMRVHAHKAK
jgi:hypothetical protein